MMPLADACAISANQCVELTDGLMPCSTLDETVPNLLRALGMLQTI